MEDGTVRLLEYHDILNPELFQRSAALQQAWDDVREAVALTDWPQGAGSFTIYPESGKKSGEGNGVKLIKVPCIRALRERGWDVERLPDVGSSVLRTGDLDALKTTPEGFVAFEWETGNISSSHRALNKLFLTMKETATIGSFLVVPSNRLKIYLTDRIGNIGELEPYFGLWRDLTGINGALRIVVVEHDAESFDVPKIPKGTDGRALR
ncbi:hypothetical protein [uncultured Thiohalocapsa sp.]|uniref:hypothetical protein n=1 Tax=uncultured Thiohalocapsa sp. TaxID=768990 RepID=UPI0025E3B89B|nr:hypothetical protein [uncultured Thiohalocapsa sp.]